MSFYTVLKSIGLSHNRIGDEGAQAIADMLRNNSSLEKLSLSANDITDEGGEPLIGSLTQNTSLMTLLLAQVHVCTCTCFIYTPPSALCSVLYMYVNLMPYIGVTDQSNNSIARCMNLIATSGLFKVVLGYILRVQLLRQF